MGSVGIGPGHEAFRSAAHAMLQALGGCKAWLLTSATTTPTAQDGLGLTAATDQEIALEPVLIRRQDDGTLEAVIEATTLRSALQITEDQHVEEYLEPTARLRIESTTHRIISLTSEWSDGREILYKLRVEE